MNPLTRAVMAVLCAFFTVKAQKTGNMNAGGGGGTNALPMAALQQNDASAPVPVAEDDARQQAAPSEIPDSPQPLNATSEPSRVVFQSTPASDPAARGNCSSRTS
jgi:hypothetical protein